MLTFVCNSHSRDLLTELLIPDGFLFREPSPINQRDLAVLGDCQLAVAKLAELMQMHAEVSFVCILSSTQTIACSCNSGKRMKRRECRPRTLR